jgi:methyl-accepting chemotaxis protein
MKDFKIGTRLTAGFAFVISIAFAFGAFAYIKAAGPSPADQLAKITLPAAYLSEDLRSNIQKQYVLFQQFLIATDHANLDRLETAIKTARSQNTDILARLEGLNSKDDTALKSAGDVFVASVDAAINISRPGTAEAKIQALQMDSDSIRTAYTNYLAQADSLVASSRSAAAEQHADPDAPRILMGLGIAILFCLVMSSLIIHSITSPLSLAARMLEHASEGDLGYRAEVKSNDELGQLLNALNTQLENNANAAIVAERLAEGDLSVQVNTLSDRDALGQALLRTRNSMLTSVDIAERLTDGNLAAPRAITSDKDRLGSTLVRLRDRMKDTMDLAEKLSEGNLEVEIKQLSESDGLGLSLLRMRANLQASIVLAATLAEGDLTADATALSDKDMLGQSLRRLQSFLSETARTVDKIYEGDLSVTVTPLSAGDTLGHSLVRMVDTLRRTLSEVVSSAEKISSVSSEVIATARHLSSGSSQHSAAAADTSSVIGNLAISLRQSSGNSQQTEKLATAAAEEGILGGEAVSQTVVVMKEVAERINLLDDIARKTDMLTLAAAVEAARAGEHGVGFGVVASELRKLVERGQTASSEIVRLTNGGVKTAECAGEFMSRMVPGVRRAAELVREIASSTEEQNQDAVRAGKSIRMLDEVIHRNVSASQQMAATAEDLVNSTRILQSTVNFFKLEPEQPLAALQKSAGS